MSKKIIAAVLSVCMFILPLFGCSSKNSDNVSDSNSQNVQTAESDEELLATVINEIYSEIDITSLSDATDDILKEQFYLNPDSVESYAIRYTDFKYGVADVMIVKPKEGKKQDILTSLETRKQSRISECENYDIHNSYQIAQRAEIYERGGYVIMLMLEDNEAAKKIIEQYIV